MNLSFVRSCQVFEMLKIRVFQKLCSFVLLLNLKHFLNFLINVKAESLRVQKNALTQNQILFETFSRTAVKKPLKN